jgi:hypothetical protein
MDSEFNESSNVFFFFFNSNWFSRISIVIHRRSHHPEHENFMIAERRIESIFFG